MVSFAGESCTTGVHLIKSLLCFCNLCLRPCSSSLKMMNSLVIFFCVAQFFYMNCISYEQAIIRTLWLKAFPCKPCVKQLTRFRRIVPAAVLAKVGLIIICFTLHLTMPTWNVTPEITEFSSFNAVLTEVSDRAALLQYSFTWNNWRQLFYCAQY
jgi:hypothetical protein